MKIKNVIPPYSESQRTALREDIRTHGQLGKVVVWNDLIIDGIECYEICKELGIEPSYEEAHFDSLFEAVKWRINIHINRRHMNVFNRIESALDLFEDVFAKEAEENRRKGAAKKQNASSDVHEDLHNASGHTVWVNQNIALLAQSNDNYVSFARQLRKDDSDLAQELLFKLRKGRITINRAKTEYNKSTQKTNKDTSTPSKGNGADTCNNLTDPVEKMSNNEYGWRSETDFIFGKDPSQNQKYPCLVFDPDILVEMISKYTDHDTSLDIACHIFPYFESVYRHGCKQYTNKDSNWDELQNRDFEVHRQYMDWLRSANNNFNNMAA